MSEVPEGWATARLPEFCSLNPRVDKSSIDDEDRCTFVPMPAVEAETGTVDVSEERAFKAVRQGFTAFMAGDVLFAKITPCMENGKMAVVPAMPYEHGFGSTEFHVLRSEGGVKPEFVYHLVSNRTFRFHAEHLMTGAVGQKRVPISVLEEHEVALPPVDEQRRIVERIETLFAEIDAGVRSLEAARTALKLYRQSLLKAAFEGRLTEQWRAANPDKLETSETLLTRIHQERKSRYEVAFADWKVNSAAWESRGGNGKKPKKPRKWSYIEPLDANEKRRFPTLPAHWSSGRLALYLDNIETGKSFKCRETEPSESEIGVVKVSAVTWGEYDETESKTCLDPTKWNEDLFVREGDFLLSRANTIELVGAVVVAHRVTKRVMLSDKTLRLKFGGGHERFFLHFLRSPYGRGEIEARSTGNQESMRNIGQDRILQIAVPVCGEAEQAEIVRILDARLSAADALDKDIEADLKRADALRQSILTRNYSALGAGHPA